jgi:hypothetical protein
MSVFYGIFSNRFILEEGVLKKTIICEFFNNISRIYALEIFKIEKKIHENPRKIFGSL